MAQLPQTAPNQADDLGFDLIRRALAELNSGGGSPTLKVCVVEPLSKLEARRAAAVSRKQQAECDAVAAAFAHAAELADLLRQVKADK